MKALYGFVSTGDKSAMYTMRIMYEVWSQWSGKPVKYLKDVYYINLSTNSSDANAKALLYCEELDIPLRGDASFDLNEIKRRKAEELAADREKAEAAQRQRDLEFEQQIVEAKKVFENTVLEGAFQTGKYLGRLVSDVAKVDIQYILWLAEQPITKGIHTKFDINIQIAKDYISNHEVRKPDYVGVIGEEIELELTLVSGYVTQGAFPSIIWTAQTDDGNIVKFFSVAKGFKTLKDGDRFKVKGTVKDHSEYRNQKNTLLNRPKIVK